MSGVKPLTSKQVAALRAAVGMADALGADAFKECPAEFKESLKEMKAALVLVRKQQSALRRIEANNRLDARIFKKHGMY